MPFPAILTFALKTMCRDASCECRCTAAPDLQAAEIVQQVVAQVVGWIGAWTHFRLRLTKRSARDGATRRGLVQYGGVRTGRRVPRPDPVSDRSWRGLPLRAAHRVLYHHYDAQRAHEIHDRMPLILSPETCDCWLTNIDPTRTTC